MRLSFHLLSLASIVLAGYLDRPQDTAESNTPETEAAAPAILQTGRVTDAANVFDDTQAEQLRGKLQEFETANQFELVVVTVPSLGGRSIESFTIDLATAWEIGQRSYRGGIVILLAPNERQVRIAVDSRSSEALSNEVTGAIVENTMLPSFGQSDYYAGIDAGVDALNDALQ